MAAAVTENEMVVDQARGSGFVRANLSPLRERERETKRARILQGATGTESPSPSPHPTPLASPFEREDEVFPSTCLVCGVREYVCCVHIAPFFTFIQTYNRAACLPNKIERVQGTADASGSFEDPIGGEFQPRCTLGVLQQSEEQTSKRPLDKADGVTQIVGLSSSCTSARTQSSEMMVEAGSATGASEHDLNQAPLSEGVAGGAGVIFGAMFVRTPT